MEYVLTIDKELEKEVEIQVPSSEFELVVNQEVDRLQKKLEIKGFRRGRVPKSLIKTKYLDSIKHEAIDQLVTRSYLEILAEKKWRPASHAKLLNVEEGETIKFRLGFEVIPEFGVDNYRNLEIFKSNTLPDDVLLEQGLRDLRERYATVKEVMRPAVVDDFITMDLETQEDNKTKQKQNDITVRIGDRNMPDEMNRALVGMRKLEHKELKIRDAIYRMFIKKIEEKELPQLNDDFAKSLRFENIEKLRVELLAGLKKAEEARIEDELKESLSKVILERIRFNLPNSLIQNEYEKILQNTKLPDSESNKERFWSIAEKRSRFNLILEKIAEKENIKVADEEVMKAIANMGVKLNSENREDVITYIGSVLNREKTIDFLYKNAKVSEKSRIISPKEATNDPNSLRH